MATILFLFVAAFLCGCAANPRDIGVAPAMTPIGEGLVQETASIPISDNYGEKFVSGSTWRDDGQDLFRDPRARRKGDILTVEISIKDKASLDNSSNRSRDSTGGVGANIDFSGTTKFFKANGAAALDVDYNGNTETKGSGTINRSESIELLVAAIVVDVLPNGNLLVSGSQEVRVNYELRELRVSGIVRPKDILTDNRISYDKIAEARIDYGGRGRLSEVQQPAWGQQIFDLITPF
ncbi:MAG: flagellar basal body L-ring protein FlgH [Hyphomicrobiaceae bacterium]